MAAFRADLPIAEITDHRGDLVIRNEINRLPVDADIAVLPVSCRRDDGIEIFPLIFRFIATHIAIPPCASTWLSCASLYLGSVACFMALSLPGRDNLLGFLEISRCLHI